MWPAQACCPPKYTPNLRRRKHNAAEKPNKVDVVLAAVAANEGMHGANDVVVDEAVVVDGMHGASVVDPDEAVDVAAAGTHAASVVVADEVVGAATPEKGNVAARPKRKRSLPSLLHRDKSLPTHPTPRTGR